MEVDKVGSRRSGMIPDADARLSLRRTKNNNLMTWLKGVHCTRLNCTAYDAILNDLNFCSLSGLFAELETNDRQYWQPI